MIFKIKNIIFILLFYLAAPLSGHTLKYHYQLNLFSHLPSNHIVQMHLYNDSTDNYIVVNTAKPRHEIKILGEDHRNIFAVNANDGEFINKNLSIANLDDDDLDEFLFTLYTEHETHLGYFNPDNPKGDLTYPYTFTSDGNWSINGFPLAVFHQQSDSPAEIAVGLPVKYPPIGKNAIRGIIALDPNTQEKRWYYPSAHYIRYLISYTDPERNEDYLFYTSSGVSNGMVFSNGAFFDFQKEKAIIDTVIYGKQSEIVFDPESSDYSSDTTSVICCLNSQGKKVWEKYLGGLFAWSGCDIVSIDDQEFILTWTQNRNSNDTRKDNIYIFDPLSGEIMYQQSFASGQLKSVMVDQDNIFLIAGDESLIKLDNRLNLISRNEYGTKLSSFGEPFDFEGIRFLPVSTNIKGTYLIGPDLKLLGSTDISGKAFFFRPWNTLVIPTKEDLQAYQIKKLHSWERIPSSILSTVVMNLSVVIILLLVIWIITMGVSRKKLARQYEDLVDSRNKLNDTTALLVQREKLAVLGILSSSVAHEINSPLGAILNSVQRLKGDQADKEMIHNNLNLIEDAARRSAQIIEKLLSGARQGERQYCNPETVIQDWFDLYHKQLSSNSIQWSLDLNSEQNLGISYTEFSQILTNLILNARDALLEIPVDEQRRIKISTFRENEVMILKVADNGPGVPSEISRTAFEPFVSLKSAGTGSGLGLWICKHILNEIHGSIRIDSNHLGGATVTVTIPLYKSNQNTKSEEHSEE